MSKNKISYYLIRFLTIPFMFLPYKIIHTIGRIIGKCAFYVMTEYRKKTLSNLALANDLKLTKKQIKHYAIKSFQNLAITVFEYPKLSREKHFNKIIKCENPEIANQIYKQKKGIIFFVGHQSNWEVLFLDGTSRMKGIAIGRPIKNKRLYQWIVAIREKNNGKIITPKNALKEGLRNLRKGIFMGIVGDQGMPDSNYSFPFFGRRAWTSTAPALLSYKTNCPIIVATTKRENGKYIIRYSDPIWPDLKKNRDSEVLRLMDTSLNILQKSIKEKPGEWLWQHNRWKQQTPKVLYKRFRQDCICIILPIEKNPFEKIFNHLSVLKSIYSRDFIFVLCPEKYKNLDIIKCDEIFYYKKYKDTLVQDYRFKLIYNFTSYKEINKHFLKLSAFEVLTIPKLQKLASKKIPKEHLQDLSLVLKTATCRNIRE